jgi:glycosyltransferase involved in cell wall biosynthesis
MRKPVLLHLINTLGRGGAEILLRDTIHLLRQYDHVVCYLHKPDDLLPEFANYPVYCLEHRTWWKSLETIAKLKKIMVAHKVDLVHAHLYDSTLLARLACSQHTNFVFTIHNIMSHDAFNVNWRSLIVEKLTYKKWQTLIAVSQFALEDYKKNVGVKGPHHVLYNYINQKFFALQYDYDKELTNGLRLVSAGNLRRQKNYGKLIKAFSLLKGQPVSLDIYGEGDLRKELQQTIDRSGASVRLMGRSEDMSKVLPDYDAYIMPSIFEGYGIAPMEAIAAGLPVLLSDLPVFREITEGVPVYFNPEDVQSIAGAISYCAANWNEVKERAKRGKEIIYEKASREKYLQQLQEIYSETMRHQGQVSTPPGTHHPVIPGSDK